MNEPPFRVRFPKKIGAPRLQKNQPERSRGCFTLASSVRGQPSVRPSASSASAVTQNKFMTVIQQSTGYPENHRRRHYAREAIGIVVATRSETTRKSRRDDQDH